MGRIALSDHCYNNYTYKTQFYISPYPSCCGYNMIFGITGFPPASYPAFLSLAPKMAEEFIQYLLNSNKPVIMADRLWPSPGYFFSIYLLTRKKYKDNWFFSYDAHPNPFHSDESTVGTLIFNPRAKKSMTLDEKQLFSKLNNKFYSQEEQKAYNTFLEMVANA